VFAKQQAWRYQTLAKQGYGTVQNAEQFTSQLHQQDAAVHTAQENLNLAQRQVESLKAQRLSAEATLAQAKAQLHQAQVNLERTRILSPVDGYVTNLLAHLSRFSSHPKQNPRIPLSGDTRDSAFNLGSVRKHARGMISERRRFCDD
jgi:multidrug resistance efflux pump